MSATPASRPIASLHRLEAALAREDVGDLADPLDEHERAHLAERVVQGVQDGEEEDRGARDARRDVAEDVELGAARALGPELEHHGHATGLERRAHRAADVHVRVGAAPARLVPACGEAALELHDHPVDRGEVLQRAGRQRAVELVQRPRRRELAGALDLRALELAPQLLLEAADLVAGQRLARLVLLRAAVRPQVERAADPLDVDAEHPGPLAAAAERGDREPGEVAHRALVAVADRLDRLGAQVVEVDLLAARSCRRTRRARAPRG